MRSIPALSLFVAAAAAGSAQEPVVRSYGVHDLLAPAPEAFLIPVGPALPVKSRGHAMTSGGMLASQPQRPASLGREALLNWLREVWSDDASATGDLAGDVLTLRAAPGTHARVQDLLGVLQGVLGRTVRLRVHVLPPEAASEGPALLDAGAVEAVLAEHAPLRSHGLDLRGDVPGLLENGRAVHILRDYDVEVAERSSISDPKTDVVFLGDRLGATVTPMADGRFWLRWGWTAARGELPFPRRALTGKGLGTLDLPVVDSVQVRSTAVLAAGEGVLTGGSREAFLLVLEEAAMPPLRMGSVAAVPLGPLAVPPLLPVARPLLVQRPGVDRPLFPDSHDYELPDLYAALAMHLGTDLGEQLELTVLGTHAIVDTQGLAQRVEALARQQAEAVHSYTLRFKAGTLPRQDAQGPADGIAARIEGGAWAVTLPDQAFALESWTERAFVRDYEVEIAQRSAVPNPVIDAALAGWSVRGTVHRTAGGLPTLVGRFQWSSVPPITPRDSGIQEIGSIDFPEVCYDEAELRAALKPGSWQVLHSGADPQERDDKVLVILVRAEQKG